MGQVGNNPDILRQIMAAQSPQQEPPTTSMLNPYNVNPYQQNQMGGMGYGMMNQIMAKMQNPQAMQNPMANPMFTSGAGYQSPMMQPNFNYGAFMPQIGGMPNPYSFAMPEPPKTGNKQSPQSGYRRPEGGNK